MAMNLSKLRIQGPAKIFIPASRLSGGYSYKTDDTEVPPKTLTKYGDEHNPDAVAYILKENTIPVAGTISIDLSGPLAVSTGDPAAFSKIKTICLENISANVSTRVEMYGLAKTVEIFSASGDKAVVPKGGELCISSPLDDYWHVAADGLEDILTIANRDPINAATINLIIVGVPVRQE